STPGLRKQRPSHTSLRRRALGALERGHEPTPAEAPVAVAGLVDGADDLGEHLADEALGVVGTAWALAVLDVGGDRVDLGLGVSVQVFLLGGRVGRPGEAQDVAPVAPLLC